MQSSGYAVLMLLIVLEIYKSNHHNGKKESIKKGSETEHDSEKHF